VGISSASSGFSVLSRMISILNIQNYQSIKFVQIPGTLYLINRTSFDDLWMDEVCPLFTDSNALSNRINTYRNASIVSTRYTQYMATFPVWNSAPTKGGNYLLKVFLNDDTSKLVFTKRFLVVNTKATVSGIITQPYNNNLFQTHQRVQANVSTAAGQINAFSPQDLKVVMLQNYIWSSANMLTVPQSSEIIEYSDERYHSRRKRRLLICRFAIKK
jgi:hypothetical protein